MKTEFPLTASRKRQIDNWLTKHYEELTKHTEGQLRRYGFEGHDGAEFMSKLYDVLLKYAYANENWATDLSILKQSKVRLTGYVKDLLKYYDKHDSTDRIQDAVEHGEATLPAQLQTEPDHWSQMLSSKLRETLDDVCKSEYDYDLIEVICGHRSCQSVADEYHVDRSTVSRHRDLLAQALREEVIRKGLVEPGQGDL